MNIINFELLKNPLNWVIVAVICLFALLLLHIISPEDQAPQPNA